MKKALTLLSVTLSLVLIAATIFVVPTFAASGSTIGENLLANPELNYTDNGDGTYKVEGWTIPSNIEYKRTSRVYTDADGKTVIEMQSTDVDTAANFATATANKQTYMLDANKNYKFTALIKIEAPDMAKDSTGATADFNHNTGYYGAYIYYQVGNSDSYRSTKRIYTSPSNSWEEYSFIIKGSEIEQGKWQYFWGIKMYGMRAKISIKSPCVAEYDGDALTMQERVETDNILPVGIQGFTVPDDDKGVYISHQNTTVELNGVDNVPAIAVETASLQEAYRISYTLRNSDTATNNLTLTGGKKYKFSAWVKVESIGHSNITSYGVSAQFCHGNTWSYDNLCQTFGEWQKVEKIIDVETFPWKYLVGISIYATGGTTYIADVRLEEFIGEITVSEQNIVPDSIVSNGKFESYDYVNNNFDGWSFYSNNNSNTLSKADGVTGNALVISTIDSNYPATNASTTVTVDPAKDYIAKVKVKATANANGTWQAPSWGGNIRMEISDPSGRMATVSTTHINAKCDWTELSVRVSDIPEGVTRLKIELRVGSTGCSAYFDDIELIPVIGGTLNIDRTNAKSGDTVYLSAVTDDGYYLNSLCYNDGTTDTYITETVSDIVCATNSNCSTYSQLASCCVYQFTMPDENITVKAVFKEIVIGDINGDEVLDIRDLVRLAQYLDDTTTIATVNADIDGNGTIETADVTALRETLLNQ